MCWLGLGYVCAPPASIAHPVRGHAHTRADVQAHTCALFTVDDRACNAPYYNVRALGRVYAVCIYTYIFYVRCMCIYICISIYIYRTHTNTHTAGGADSEVGDS